MINDAPSDDNHWRKHYGANDVVRSLNFITWLLTPLIRKYRRKFTRVTDNKSDISNNWLPNEHPSRETEIKMIHIGNWRFDDVLCCAYSDHFVYHTCKIRISKRHFLIRVRTAWRQHADTKLKSDFQESE